MMANYSFGDDLDYYHDDLEGYSSWDEYIDDDYEEMTDEEILEIEQKNFPDPKDKALLRTLLIDGGLSILQWRQGSETKEEIEEEAKKEIRNVARRIAFKFSSDQSKKREMLLFAVRIFYSGHRVEYKKRSGFRLRDPLASRYLRREDYIDDLSNSYGGRL